MKIKKSKILNSDSIGLKLKEELDENNLFISSYNINSLKINDKSYQFPISIIGHDIYEINLKSLKDFSINNIKILNKKFYEKNLVDPELFLVGLSAYNQLDFIQLRKECNKIDIGIELMKTSSACGTFNFLTIEKRNFVAIFI